MTSAVWSTSWRASAVADQRRDDLDAARPRQRERDADVVGAAIGPADEADLRAVGQTGDLVDELDVAGSDQHRHDRDATGGQHLGLVGMERRRGHDVVVEALEAVGQVVEQRPLGLDQPWELVAEPLGIEAGVGVGALGEEHPDERSRSLAFGGGGEGGRGQLVGGETGVGRATKHLGDDPGERLGATLLWRAFGDVGARTVATHDVTGVGQTTIDRPDGIGVHSQCRTKLAHGRQARARQQPTGVDLVGQLPVDLGRDRNIGVALDIERPTGPTHHPGSAIVDRHRS